MAAEEKVCLRWNRRAEHFRLAADARGHRALLIPRGVTEAEAGDFLRGWREGGAYSPCGAALFSFAEREGAALFTGGGKWGACRLSTGEIRLNEALSSFPLDCAAMILAHERCHLREGAHSPAFFALLRGAMPDWAYWEGVLRGGWQERKRGADGLPGLSH